MKAPAAEALIETIYASTVLSRSLDDIVSDFEGEVLNRLAARPGGAALDDLLEPDVGAETLVPPDIDRHIALARRIQSEMGFAASPLASLFGAIERIANPALAFDAEGVILSINSAARRAGWKGDRLGSLLAGAGRAEAILCAAQAIAVTDNVSAVPVRFHIGGETAGAPAIVKRAGARASGASGRPIWLLMLADLAIDDSLAEQARALFGFTKSEAMVAVRFVQGVSLDAIAGERRVSIETIRSQIKSIKAKAGARDLHALMRLLCALASGVYLPVWDAAAAASAEAPWMDTMRLPDGRRFDFIRQGAARGAPVLLAHTLAYGAQLPAAAHLAAVERGLSIIAPIRAGHGFSEPAPHCAPDALLDLAADDMAALLDHIGVKRARLIGNAAGATHAIRFAHRHPTRVESVLIISRGPVWRNQWLSELSPNHRALAIVQRHMPAAARLVVGAIIQHFSRHGPYDYAATAARDSPPDLAALAEPEMLHLIGHGVTFGLQQGPEAYCREFELMQLDLTAEARAMPHPIAFIYGLNDQIVPPTFVRRFADAVPQTRLIEVADAGHFLFFSHWRQILDALA